MKSQRRLPLALLLLAASCAPNLLGCEKREELINEVGGAPKAQVDLARDRLDAASAKYQGAAATAEAVSDGQ